MQLLVTVQGGPRALDIELPGDVRVAELLPLLLQMCELPAADMARWTISRATTGQLLQTAETCLAQGVADGEVLRLRPVGMAVSRVEAPGQHRPQETLTSAAPEGSITVTWESLLP